MNLRTKFILLTIGVTVFPFLLTGVTVALQFRLNNGPAASPHTMPSVRRAVEKYLPRYLGKGDPASLDKIAKLGFPLIIYEEGHIVFSSIPRFRNQESVSKTTLLEYAGEADTGEKPGILVMSYSREGNEGMILAFGPADWLFSERKFSVGLAVYPISIIIFAGILSLVIIRSINTSIRVLEQATREIASGNLSFQLEDRGTDSFASLSRSFRVMQEKLKEEQAKRSRFIMGVSHDLNTPLTLIEGYVDAITDGYADSEEKLKKYLEIIKGKSRVLGNRIAQLIEFVNMETGQWKFILKPVRLSRFMHQLSEVYRDEAEIMKYQFRTSIDLPEELSVQLDEDLMRRVFDNLIQNAVQYSGSETTAILLEARLEGKEVVISVSNRGKGIQEDEQELIFEPFYRGNRDRDHKGFGLGLSSVRSVVESHGWKITLSSIPGETTAFSIHIPTSA